MTVQSNDQKGPAASSTPDNENPSSASHGTEADNKGGVDEAKRSAERDWEDSAKESGE